jgi:hypothetical protein
MNAEADPPGPGAGNGGTERRRILTRAQVLAWRGDKWSCTDKQAIAQSLDLLPADRAEFYEESAGGRVILAVDGKPAFIIRPGFVSWPKGTWMDGVDHSLFASGVMVGSENDGTMWAQLSTYRGSERSKHVADRDFGTCPTCWLELPATGVCGNCD